MYAVVDIETTSGSPKTGKITEIAIYIYNGSEIIDSFTSLVNPECDIPFYITNITGITNQMVANAPKFYEIAKKVVEITSNRIFVAHNASFDYNFIKKEFNSLGFDYNRKTMCTVKLGRKFIPGHQSYSLGKICGELGIDINGRHRAAGDALATVKLLDIILKNYQKSESGLFS
jgi:DNA polymerase-3 subunit epsilon